MLKALTLVTAILCALLPQRSHAEDTFIFTVQISASVLDSPSRLLLQWKPDPWDPNGLDIYTIYRKSKEGTTWGTPIATLGAGSTSYLDWGVSPGSAYEYQIVNNTALGHKSYGYIYAGVRAAFTEFRGKMLLVVASESTQGLDVELSRLESDLSGDGWQVLRKTVSSNDTPTYVRSLIRSEYLADPGNVNTVFLLGHVPVLLSGNLNYDGHQWRAMPADAYYGEMTEGWSVHPDWSPSYMPSDIELMVGRVDFFDMPGIGASPAWPTEREALRLYLQKNHAWRHGTMTAPRRALMGNRRGDEGGRATAASGYRFFEPIVGPSGVVEANTSDSTSDYNRWISVLGRDEYLLAYGCGGGLPQGISWLGTRGPYKEAWSRDVTGLDAKAVFTMLFGSWFGEWQKQDNFMRSFLLTSKGLGVCLAGSPHWYAHHVALGEPVGYSARLTMNNSTMYKNELNEEPRAVYIAWLGDPTLRMDVVRPVSSLLAVRNGSFVTLSWTASPDAGEGYHVFRATGPNGPFSRLTQNPVTSTSFTNVSAEAGTYMVRAMKLESRFSGSYYNLSQGMKAEIGAAPVPPPPSLQISRVPAGVAVAWSAQPGVTYHVEKRGEWTESWVNASGALTANGTTLTWTNSTSGSSRAYYRVVSP